MNKKLPIEESVTRVEKLRFAAALSELDAVFVFDKIEQLYYAGSMQNGIIVVPVKEKRQPLFFVRRSLERAKSESPFVDILQYISYRDIANFLTEKNIAHLRVGIDESSLSLATYKMVVKSFPNTTFVDCSSILKKNRAVKSEYELEKLKIAGLNSTKVLKELPNLLYDGITEWELSQRLFRLTSEYGNNCISRLAPGSGEFFLGNICFGDSSLAPTAFDGPGGLVGRSPFCPHGGSLRKLSEGDLIYIDIAYPFDEYYVDKTRVFSYKRSPEKKILEAHAICLQVQEFVRERLCHGAVPSKIYDEVYEKIISPLNLTNNFMGYGSNCVKFLGHGIGLVVNEYPVIAKKFDEPLEKGMVLAVEPKMGIPGVGLVGIENTFLVTASGGECITLDSNEIQLID